VTLEAIPAAHIDTAARIRDVAIPRRICHLLFMPCPDFLVRERVKKLQTHATTTTTASDPGDIPDLSVTAR
jgi:hypothetical protein